MSEKPESYIVLCVHCNAAFNAMTADWCGCKVPMRSVRCKNCGQCLCTARPSQKNKFWVEAPLSLRQNRHRFGAAHPVFEAFDPSPVEVRSDGPAVVVVDDDEAMRSLVACFVEQLGYRVLVAEGPEEAYALTLRDDVCVLITDALMPRVDGRELCRRVKRSERGGSKKVIVMTSLYTAHRFRFEAFRLFEVDEYLSKPIDLSLLSQALRRLTGAPTAAARAGANV